MSVTTPAQRLLFLLLLTLLVYGCARVERGRVVSPPDTALAPTEAPKPPVPARPLPRPEDLVFLPQPRVIHVSPETRPADGLTPAIRLDASEMPHPQGYVLSITPEALTIIARDAAGAFYAQQTLKQLSRQYAGTGRLPVARVEDWPDFPNRGVMLDVSRDKVPTMETLFQLVDLFAELKYNQLQLYTEHAFAYAGHEQVWQNASPMTPEQIRELDQYCRDRFIELVPNQNSFGHMHRWLRHEAYSHLGETPFGPDLCPVNPDSVAFLKGLYDDLLPNFSSRQFNVGCDETFTLGMGCSADAVKRLGKGRVYLNFLKQIHALVQSHGRTMQFWGDIILEHPELIPELPPNIIAMEWGYEANHPFAARGRKFADSGVPFYVCPGTSSWNSLLGRTSNALENLRLAARNGLDNGAIGYLVTDWGDSGHWQCMPVSLAPFAYGAAVSWAYDANAGIDLPRAVDTHIFLDRAGVMTAAALDLGDAHALTGVTPRNYTIYYVLLEHAVEEPTSGFLAGMNLDGIRNARTAIHDALARMEQARMDRPDAALILEEFRVNARMALFALQLGEERLLAGGTGTSQIPVAVRAELALTFRELISTFQQVWRARNREGGLVDSVGRMEQVLARLER